MTYRAGIVGTGGVAGMGIYDGSADDVGDEPEEASHAGGYAAVEDTELVAVADVDAEALDRFGRAWGIPEDRRYLGHEAMLEAEDLDVVSVCTPSLMHREHVEDAARLGDPEVIWCEKPIACSVGAGESMVATCRAEDVELLINHSQRFLRQHQALREAITDGLLGEVRSVSAGSPMELLRVGTHVVDLVRFLLDARVTSVAGHVTGENQAGEDLTDRDLDDAGAGGFFLLEDGTFVTFDGTTRRDVGTFHQRINGTEGRLVNAEHGWRYFEDGVEADSPLGGFDDDHEQSFVNAVTHAVDLIEDGAENVSTGEEAVHTLEVLVGMYASHYTGGRTSIPLDRPLTDLTIRSW